MIKIKELLKKEKFQKQIYKLLLALIVCLFFLLVVELVFKIPFISDTLSPNSLQDHSENNNNLIWIVLWLLMYAQVTIIPMPAMPIHSFCIKTTLVSFEAGVLGLFSFRTLFYVLFVTSACLAGSLTAYFIGRLGGKKVVTWIAGGDEDYIMWSKKLNCRAGKWIYAATVLLPVFPDDIICLVVGSMRFDLKFYTIVNVVNRFIGTYCLLLFMRMPIVNVLFSGAVGNNFPWALVIYSSLFVLSIVAAIIWRLKVIKK